MITPILDKQDKFMFYSNNKVVQQSIARSLLKDRVVVYKNDVRGWKNKMNGYTEDDLSSIFKFTIVRNPFDKVVSAFFYLQRVRIINKRISFKDYIMRTLASRGEAADPHFNLQHNRAFNEDGTQFVDFIGRYENLKKDWKYIAKKIDAPQNLPHVNKTSHKPYTSYYDDETIAVVEKLYKKDLKLFGYSYE